MTPKRSKELEELKKDDELKDILLRLHYPCSRLYCNCGNKMSDAITAIEKWAKEKFLENLPKEKEKPKSEVWLDWNETDFLHAGFNECLAEIKRRMG